MDENITNLIMMAVYVFIFIAAVNSSMFFLKGIDEYAANIYEFMDKHGGTELNQISNAGEEIIKDTFYFDGATVVSYMANFGYFTNETDFNNALSRSGSEVKNYMPGIKYITDKKINVLDVGVLIKNGSNVITNENQVKVTEKYEMTFVGQNSNGVKFVRFNKVT